MLLHINVYLYTGISSPIQPHGVLSCLLPFYIFMSFSTVRTQVPDNINSFICLK